MRNATIFILIQNQQHRMSYGYSNQSYNSICLMLILRCTTNIYMRANMRYVLKCIPNFDVYHMNKLKNSKETFSTKGCVKVFCITLRSASDIEICLPMN